MKKRNDLINIAIISLGCPKNQVDADVFCRALIERGGNTVPDTEAADVIIINTCGFIESAKSEAIECILDACAQKQVNPGLKVIVTGCLAERYREEMVHEIPEIDAVVGIGKNADLPNIVAQLTSDNANDTENTNEPMLYVGPKQDLPLGGARVISTPGHYAWLKIAEGCSNACSYCAIPMIRGPMRSRPLEDCVAEAAWLADQGVRELVLVAQDVTAYGMDQGSPRICELLNALNEIKGIHWIRLLYCYPEKIDDALLDAVARNQKVLHYFDIPIQHISDRILTSMRRKGGASAIRDAISRIRKRLPNATLRTSLIVGYPGETEEEFAQLCDFVAEIRFDRLGCFAFSPEEGTPAYDLPGLLPQEEREQRAQQIMELQGRILLVKQESLAGTTMEVICDDFDEELEMWRCRPGSDAPEIDMNVLLAADAPLSPGSIYRVQITGTEGLDLMAAIDNNSL